MKRGALCLLLLSGCLTVDGPRTDFEYALTWTCRSPEGCERTEEVERIDRVERMSTDWHFTSTQEETFAADARQVPSDLIPRHCAWLYYLSLFDHELERSRVCYGPGGFDLELSIPNQDPTTFSMWLVEGRELDLL